jgi:hypothetical protein
MQLRALSTDELEVLKLRRLVYTSRLTSSIKHFYRIHLSSLFPGWTKLFTQARYWSKYFNWNIMWNLTLLYVNEYVIHTTLNKYTYVDYILKQVKGTQTLPNAALEWLTIYFVFVRYRVQISAGRPAILIELFVVLLGSSGKIPGQFLKLGQDRVLPIRCSPAI